MNYEMKTLEEYSKLLKQYAENPHELSKVGLELGADYSYLSSLLISIKEKKPQVWVDIKYSDGDKALSDKLTDMKYRLTEDGKYEYMIELKMKAIEKMMSMLKNNQYVLNQENKNQW